MNKKMTTSQLRDLLFHLKKWFYSQAMDDKIEAEEIDVHARVLHINSVTKQTEEIRIPDAFLGHHLPIPDHSILHIHVQFPKGVASYHIKSALQGILKHNSMSKDIKIEDNEIIFTSLKTFKSLNADHDLS